MDLSVRDWEKIGGTPVLVFAAVARADGNISDEELGAFANTWLPRLTAFEVSDSEHDLKVFQWAVKEGAARWEAIIRQDTDRILGALSKNIRLLEELLSEEEAQAWKAALMQLAIDVAEASGGFLGLTSAVDSDEQRVLSRIKYILQDKPVL